MSKLTDLLKQVQVGQPQAHANMQVFPLHVQNGHERGYRTLDEAMAAEQLMVKEVSEGGSVPNLAVQNTGELPVLLVVGEELIGAKQNRVLNTSILVPAQSELNIPVSCVEQGRWRYTSRAFESSTTSSHFKLRKTQTQNVTANLRKKATYDADQQEVWSEVSRKISSHRSTSSTQALHDMYEQTEDNLKDYLGAFTPPDDAEGILITINGQVAGADLFDHHDTLGRLWPKLLRSYAIDALERSHDQEPAGAISDTRQFLDSAQLATEEVYDSIGLGEDVRLSSTAVTGSGLVWNDHMIHASLFSAES